MLTCALVLGAASACVSRGPLPEAATATLIGQEPVFGQLTDSEQQQLRRGERVEKPAAFQHLGARYIGGVSHQLVAADPDYILQALLDPSQLEQMLPQTQRVTALGVARPAPGLELEQGNSLLKATYSVVLDHDLENREIRFRLDRSRRRDIQDVHGFFRVTAHDGERSLITVAAAVDVGSGLVRLMFKDTIQQLILMTPTTMKGIIEASAEVQRRDQVAQLR